MSQARSGLSAPSTTFTLTVPDSKDLDPNAPVTITYKAPNRLVIELQRQPEPNSELIKELLKRTTNIDATDSYEKTALAYALERINSSDPIFLEAVFSLIEKGANPNHSSVKQANYDLTELRVLISHLDNPLWNCKLEVQKRYLENKKAVLKAIHTAEEKESKKSRWAEGKLAFAVKDPRYMWNKVVSGWGQVGLIAQQNDELSQLQAIYWLSASYLSWETVADKTDCINRLSTLNLQMPKVALASYFALADIFVTKNECKNSIAELKKVKALIKTTQLDQNEILKEIYKFSGKYYAAYSKKEKALECFRKSAELGDLISTQYGTGLKIETKYDDHYFYTLMIKAAEKWGYDDMVVIAKINKLALFSPAERKEQIADIPGSKESKEALRSEISSISSSELSEDPNLLIDEMITRLEIRDFSPLNSEVGTLHLHFDNLRQHAEQEISNKHPFAQQILKDALKERLKKLIDENKFEVNSLDKIPVKNAALRLELIEYAKTLLQQKKELLAELTYRQFCISDVLKFTTDDKTNVIQQALALYESLLEELLKKKEGATEKADYYANNIIKLRNALPKQPGDSKESKEAKSADSENDIVARQRQTKFEADVAKIVAESNKDGIRQSQKAHAFINNMLKDYHELEIKCESTAYLGRSAPVIDKAAIRAEQALIKKRLIENVIPAFVKPPIYLDGSVFFGDDLRLLEFRKELIKETLAALKKENSLIMDEKSSTVQNAQFSFSLGELARNLCEHKNTHYRAKSEQLKQAYSLQVECYYKMAKAKDDCKKATPAKVKGKCKEITAARNHLVALEKSPLTSSAEMKEEANKLMKKLDLLSYRKLFDARETGQSLYLQQVELVELTKKNIFPAIYDLDFYLSAQVNMKEKPIIGRRLYLSARVALGAELALAENEFEELKLEEYAKNSMEFINTWSDKTRTVYHRGSDEYEYQLLAKWYFKVIKVAIPALRISENPEEQRWFKLRDEDPDLFLLTLVRRYNFREKNDESTFSRADLETIRKRLKADMGKALNDSDWVKIRNRKVKSEAKAAMKKIMSSEKQSDKGKKEAESVQPKAESKGDSKAEPKKSSLLTAAASSVVSSVASLLKPFTKSPNAGVDPKPVFHAPMYPSFDEDQFNKQHSRQLEALIAEEEKREAEYVRPSERAGTELVTFGTTSAIQGQLVTASQVCASAGGEGTYVPDAPDYSDPKPRAQDEEGCRPVEQHETELSSLEPGAASGASPASCASPGSAYPSFWAAQPAAPSSASQQDAADPAKAVVLA